MITDTDKHLIICAEYIIQTGCTVRTAAEKFGLSKSTIHLNMTEKLPDVNKYLASGVYSVLQKNKNERAKRGGQSTKRKYEALRQERDIRRFTKFFFDNHNT